MEEQITIRRAERRDEEALLKLWKDFFQEQSALDSRFQLADDVEERWRNDFSLLLKHDRRRLFVAVQEGEVAGFINAVRWAPPPVYALTSEVYVEEFYVQPEARGSGVGAQLLSAVTGWARELGAVRLRLGALAANKEGCEFWERHHARPFAVTYTIDLESSTPSKDEGHKARLGF